MAYRMMDSVSLRLRKMVDPGHQGDEEVLEKIIGRVKNMRR